MQDTWLEALGGMVYGMYVLTAAVDGRIGGMIASWVSQVSYDPPLISVAVHPHRFTHTLIQDSGGFALHVLAGDQVDFLSRFKGPEAKAKFEGLTWRHGLTGSPVLEDCVAYLECRVHTILAPGNHTLFLGEIVDAGRVREERPLCTLDYRGMYLGKE